MSFMLIPRLNYKYTLCDIFISVSALFKKSINDNILKEKFGVKEIYYYNHARTAMRIALSSLNLKPNANIGIMGFNCLTVMNSVNSAGFNIVFLDITDDFQVDLTDFDKKKNKIDALIINHMFGIPNKSIIEIQNQNPSLPIIEDCAHSLLTEIGGKLTGLYGDISVFSFGRGKFPSVGDGGFMIVNKDEYRAQIKNETDLLKPVSFFSEIKNIFNGVGLSVLHIPFVYKNVTLKLLKGVDNKKDFVGKYSTKESSFYKTNVFLFLKKIKRIEEFLNTQKSNGKLLKSVLPDSSLTYTGDFNYFMLPVVFENRGKFIQSCALNGVEIGKHFAKTIQWAKEFGYTQGNCPNAEKISEKIITLPTHYNMTKKHLERLMRQKW